MSESPGWCFFKPSMSWDEVIVSSRPVSGPVAWMWYVLSQQDSVGKIDRKYVIICITKTSWRRSSFDLTMNDLSAHPSVLRSSDFAPTRSTFARHSSRFLSPTDSPESLLPPLAAVGRVDDGRRVGLGERVGLERFGDRLLEFLHLEEEHEGAARLRIEDDALARREAEDLRHPLTRVLQRVEGHRRQRHSIQVLLEHCLALARPLARLKETELLGDVGEGSHEVALRVEVRVDAGRGAVGAGGEARGAALAQGDRA